MAQLVWLITGTSSGIGEQLVHHLLARGDKVIATARKLNSIKSLENVGATILQLDVTDSQKSIDDSISKAIKVHGQIDVLVNNAGYICVGTWEDLEYEDFKAQFDTNVFGTIKTTRAVLPHFRQLRAGNLLFLSSLSGWIGHPGGAAYAGSKFALEGMVEALRDEVSPFGIRTFLIEPGRFKTKFLSSQKMKSVATNIADYADFSRSKLEGLAREDNNQPGDTEKLVEFLIDLVHGDGPFEGKEVPFRLPLGVDCYDVIEAKCTETLKLLEEWKTVIRSTDRRK